MTPMIIKAIIGVIIICIMVATWSWIDKNHPTKKWYCIWVAFCTVLTMLAIISNGFIFGI